MSIFLCIPCVSNIYIFIFQLVVCSRCDDWQRGCRSRIVCYVIFCKHNMRCIFSFHYVCYVLIYVFCICLLLLQLFALTWYRSFLTSRFVAALPEVNADDAAESKFHFSTFFTLVYIHFYLISSISFHPFSETGPQDFL